MKGNRIYYIEHKFKIYLLGKLLQITTTPKTDLF